MESDTSSRHFEETQPVLVTVTTLAQWAGNPTHTQCQKCVVKVEWEKMCLSLSFPLVLFGETECPWAAFFPLGGPSPNPKDLPKQSLVYQEQ